MSNNGTPHPSDPRPAHDCRLYLPYAEGWDAKIKHGWDAEYCFSKSPGEDFFHQLMNGEIFIQRGDEKYCLQCALKQRIITTDRLYWQRREMHPPPPPRAEERP